MTTMLRSNSNPTRGSLGGHRLLPDHELPLCGPKDHLSSPLPTAPSSYDEEDDHLVDDNSINDCHTHNNKNGGAESPVPKKLAMDRLVKVSQLLRQGKALHNNRSNYKACLALLRLTVQQQRELKRRQEIQQQQQRLLQQLREIQRQQQQTKQSRSRSSSKPTTTMTASTTQPRRRVHFDASSHSDPTDDLDVDFDVTLHVYDRGDYDPDYDRPYVWWSRDDYLEFFDRDEADFQCVYSDMAHTKNMLQLWGACSREKALNEDNNKTLLRALLVETDRDLEPPGAGAWGLEHRIVTEIRNHRNKAVQAVLQFYQQKQQQQNTNNNNQENGGNQDTDDDSLCPRYIKFSQTAQRFAQALAQGNASYVQEFVYKKDHNSRGYNGDHHRHHHEVE